MGQRQQFGRQGAAGLGQGFPRHHATGQTAQAGLLGIHGAAREHQVQGGRHAQFRLQQIGTAAIRNQAQAHEGEPQGRVIRHDQQVGGERQ